MLAAAWLAAGVKDHVAALNETSHRLDQPVENEVSFTSGEATDRHHHPHQTVPGKPTKLDVNVNQMIETDDRYRVEAMENSTNVHDFPEEEEEEEGTIPGSRVLGNDPLDNNATDASRITSGSGDGRKGEKGKEERRQDARGHVVMIRGPRKELVAGRKARNFLNGESA